MYQQEIITFIIGLNQMLTSDLVKLLDIKDEKIQANPSNLELNDIMND
jgi:hypothetical protein